MRSHHEGTLILTCNQEQRSFRCMAEPGLSCLDFPAASDTPSTSPLPAELGRLLSCSFPRAAVHPSVPEGMGSPLLTVQGQHRSKRERGRECRVRQRGLSTGLGARSSRALTPALPLPHSGLPWSSYSLVATGSQHKPEELQGSSLRIGMAQSYCVFIPTLNATQLEYRLEPAGPVLFPLPAR